MLTSKEDQRQSECFEFFKELNTILGGQDNNSPRYMCETDICTDSLDRDSLTGEHQKVAELPILMEKNAKKWMMTKSRK